jgi:hypothetical protein
MKWFVATEKPRLRTCVLQIPLGLSSAFIPFTAWECIGLFKGDVVKAHGNTPAQAFKAYQEQCRNLSPIRTRLTDWIKS